MLGYKQQVFLHRDGCQALPGAGTVWWVGCHPTVPQHHTMTCDVSSLLFQPALLSLLLASWAFPEHLCGASPSWLHFMESESSLFGHTFWILSGLAGADITQLLISSLMADYLLPLSSLATLQTELLLSDYFYVFRLKKVTWISVQFTPIDSSKSTSFPEVADTSSMDAPLLSMVFNILGSKLYCCFTSLWCEDDGKVNIWKKPQPHKESIPFRAICFFSVVISQTRPWLLWGTKGSKAVKRFSFTPIHLMRQIHPRDLGLPF